MLHMVILNVLRKNTHLTLFTSAPPTIDLVAVRAYPCSLHPGTTAKRFQQSLDVNGTLAPGTERPSASARSSPSPPSWEPGDRCSGLHRRAVQSWRQCVPQKADRSNNGLCWAGLCSTAAALKLEWSLVTVRTC